MRVLGLAPRRSSFRFDPIWARRCSPKPRRQATVRRKFRSPLNSPAPGPPVVGRRKSKMNYWIALEELIKNEGYTIDRKKGTKHPKYEGFIYKVDYGFIQNSTSMDGSGIDVFVGTLQEDVINGIFCTIDKMKNDSEIKVVYKCTTEEIKEIDNMLNESKYMKAMYIENK